MDRNAFLQLTQSLNLGSLTPSEAMAMKRFEQNPNGPGFVSVADILRKRGYLDESTVVLEDGVVHFPTYYSAKAALAKNFFQKGLYEKSLECLKDVVEKSPDNLMAQRLRLRLAVHFGELNVAKSRLEVLKRLAPEDEFTRNIRILIEHSEWEKSPGLLEQELKQQGISYTAFSNTNSFESQQDGEGQTELPILSNPFSKGISVTFASSKQYHLSEMPVLGKENNFMLEDKTAVYKNTVAEEFSAGTVRKSELYAELGRFKRDEVTNQSVGSAHEKNSESDFNLESETLAEIYLSQGQTLKSLQMYQNLLKKEPGNKNFSEKISFLESKLASSSAEVTLGVQGLQETLNQKPIPSFKEQKIEKLSKLLKSFERAMQH